MVVKAGSVVRDARGEGVVESITRSRRTGKAVLHVRFNTVGMRHLVAGEDRFVLVLDEGLRPLPGQ